MTTAENRFTSAFGKYACEGDAIETRIDGFYIRARIVRDDHAGAPDEHRDGFWPSLDPDDPGYIGEASENRLAFETARAHRLMTMWKNDEWFFCGIVLSVEKSGIVLDRNAASLWGLECNYPRHPLAASAADDFPNNYLTEIANELLDDALAEGKKTLARLCGCACRAANPIMPASGTMSLPQPLQNQGERS
jgi:hypothetical protein